MKNYPVGTTVKVTLPFLDSNGDPVVPTGLSYQVLDETDAVITTVGGIDFDPSDTEYEATIPGNINATAGARVVRLHITTGNGVFHQETTYALVDNRLIFLENTFQTYTQAQLTANDIPNLTSWLGATDDQRKTALIEAYTRLTKLNYLVKWPQDIDDQSIYNINTDDYGRITPLMWPLMSEELFATYPDVFVQALRKAQVAEANDILSNDPIGARRRAGLMSETIGESSMMFRPGVRPLELAVGRNSLTYLTGYLDTRYTLTRS